MLVDVLRGRVKVNTHCYEATGEHPARHSRFFLTVPRSRRSCQGALQCPSWIGEALTRPCSYQTSSSSRSRHSTMLTRRISSLTSSRRRMGSRPHLLSLRLMPGKFILLANCALSHTCTQIQARSVQRVGVRTQDPRREWIAGGHEGETRTLSFSSVSHPGQSDHPVLDSRFLLFEAQQAHYYGLPWNLALSAVTTTPANALGLDHRVGYIRKGEISAAWTQMLFD